MPVTVADDVDFSPEPKEVAVVVSKDDRAAGVVHVTIRPLPEGKFPSIAIQRVSALWRVQKARPIGERIDRKEPVTKAEADEWAGALADYAAVNLELCRWGVVDHRAADFKRASGDTIPFESATLTFNREAYPVASNKMLRIYRMSNAPEGAAAGPLLASLGDAVSAFQANQIHTPEEVWAEAEREKEEEAAEAVAVYLRTVTGSKEAQADPPLPENPLL